jgi:hypothetical protein
MKNTYIVIPVKTGIQQNQKSRAADKTILQPRHTGNYSINWIPACAGMTGL